MAIKHDCSYRECEPPEVRRLREKLAAQGVTILDRPPVWYLGGGLRPAATSKPK